MTSPSHVERLWELEKVTTERGLDAWALIAHDARGEIERLTQELAVAGEVADTLRSCTTRAVDELDRLRAALENVMECWRAAADPSKPQRVLDMGALEKLLQGEPT